MTCGLGISPSTNQYKFIRMVSVNSKSIVRDVVSYAEICTVGVDDNWRTLENVTCPYHLEFKGLWFQGAVHWMRDPSFYRLEKRSYEFIYAFEVGEEKFRVILFPLGLEMKGASYQLSELKNSLCMSFYLCPDRLEIWRMKEYGVVESWFKEYCIAENWPSVCGLPTPIKVWRDGEILITSRNGFISYNLNERKYSQLVIQGIQGFGLENTFVPSFTSLKNLLIGATTL